MTVFADLSVRERAAGASDHQYYGAFHVWFSARWYVEWARGCRYDRTIMLEGLKEAADANVLLNGTIIGVTHDGQVERITVVDSTASLEVAVWVRTAISHSPAMKAPCAPNTDKTDLV